MQPTYMPWAGYLNLMSQVDMFVYLDDAQYERASWQNRNRVLVNGVTTWLTVPVIRGHLGASINQVEVDDAAHWRRKHSTLLANAYARHPHVCDVGDITKCLGASPQSRLSELNMALLDHMRQCLGIAVPVIRSSELQVAGTRTARLISILNKLNATEYVTPPGALGYLQEDRFVDECSIKLFVHDFQPPEYPQRKAESFISHLSILDVIANLGWAGTKNYVCPGVETVHPFVKDHRDE